MIKEDHFACTTRMFEIFGAPDDKLGQTRTHRQTTWIVRTTQVHLSFRTHTLAAIRLFTCQRASIFRSPFPCSLLVEARTETLLQTTVATFVTVAVCPPIGEADSIVSSGGVNRVRRNFSTRVFDAQLPAKRRRTQRRRNVPGSNEPARDDRS